MSSKVIQRVRVAILLLMITISGIGIWFSFGGYSLNVPYLSLGVKSSPVWDIDVGDVLMFIENGTPYQHEDKARAEEWESLAPGEGIIYQRNPRSGELEEYTISMFHQLRCLNVIHLELLRPSRFEERAPNEPVIRHCVNYLRQMVLCRSDLYLENIRDPIGPHSVDPSSIRTCKDWRKVYDAAAASRQSLLSPLREVSRG
ncbi:hypothetical protein SCHPADRAFT_993654 [Schizopora paradoxa]|uniref:Uncharacterized protein n=1 Tax=Schizopora paradoxa TaxID=27342 RepID=A0A0H2S953_9AGAM|nr:hypothetical protein SCHPADRAFT_993654 [Schizopora paradoxa]